MICYQPYPGPCYMWDTVDMQTQKVSKVPPFDGMYIVLYVYFNALITIPADVFMHVFLRLETYAAYFLTTCFICSTNRMQKQND